MLESDPSQTLISFQAGRGLVGEPAGFLLQGRFRETVAGVPQVGG